MRIVVQAVVLARSCRMGAAISPTWVSRAKGPVFRKLDGSVGVIAWVGLCAGRNEEWVVLAPGWDSAGRSQSEHHERGDAEEVCSGFAPRRRESGDERGGFDEA